MRFVSVHYPCFLPRSEAILTAIPAGVIPAFLGGVRLMRFKVDENPPVNVAELLRQHIGVVWHSHGPRPSFQKPHP